jgi:hypothetical protein
MTPKLSNLDIILGYWNKNPYSCFRFNKPKQCSNGIILVSFCSSHLAIKNCYRVSQKNRLFALFWAKTKRRSWVSNLRSFVQQPNTKLTAPLTPLWPIGWRETIKSMIVLTYWDILYLFIKGPGQSVTIIWKNDIRKDHENWSIFYFYDMFWIVVVFEIIAFEIYNLLQALRCNT